MRTYPPPVEFAEPPDRLNGLRFVIDDKAGDAVIDDFRYRAGPERDNRRAARHRFDHHQAERLRPIDRKQQSGSIGEKFLLGFIVNFADQSDSLAVDLRFKPLLEVTPLATRHFRRDVKRHSRGARDADGDFRTLLGGKPAEKGKIGAAFEAGTEQTGGQAVIDGAKPVRVAKRAALIVRNGNEGRSRKAADNIRHAWQIQSPMHGGEERDAEPAQQWQMQPVDMDVDHVELGGVLRHRFQQHCLRRDRIGTRSAQPQRARPDRIELRARHRITAGEKRDIMSKLHQLVDQPGNHPLGAAIEFRGNAFGQRGDLSNPHGSSVSNQYLPFSRLSCSKASTCVAFAAFHGSPKICGSQDVILLRLSRMALLTVLRM